MPFEYVRDYYKVPAEYGRRVIISGEPGIIIADRGHYIGVNLDKDKPGIIVNAHPISEVQYLDIGTPRKLTASQERYQRYRECCECFENFRAFLLYDSIKEK